MTIKTISNAAYIGGYTLASKFAGLKITKSGTVNGTGVYLQTYGTVSNYGTVSGSSDGLQMMDGGLLDNAAGGQISGGNGVYIAGSAVAAVTNDGTISSATGDGVIMRANNPAMQGVETLLNGAANNTAALIEGYVGVSLYDETNITNFGTIQGAGVGSNGVGVYVAAGGAGILTNGGPGHGKALIAGATGVEVASGAFGAITNYGVIDGQGGYAILFEPGSENSQLTVEAGCSFVGAVNGGGGALNLASGTGTLTGLLGGGNVTISGSMAKTTFQDFNTLTVDAPASFTLAGNSSIAAGQMMSDAGTLTTAGTLTLNSFMGLSGVLAGTGTLSITDTGDLELDGGCSLTIAKVKVATTEDIQVNRGDITYAGQWTQTAGTVTTDGEGANTDTFTFTGSGNRFTGTLTGVIAGAAGAFAFMGGSDLFDGLTLSAKSEAIGAGATVTLEGGIDLTTVLTATTPNLIVAGNGATLTGRGQLVLTDTASNAIAGAGATARLTNDDRIQGAGQLGDGKMELVNAAIGSIVGNDALALVINTGAATIGNAGLIESAGAGGVILDSAIDNTGKLVVAKGTLTVDGAVTGAGKVYIEGGVADFGSAFTENVAFSGKSGVLELAKSQSYKGTISGFSKTGANTLDLVDIAFGAKTRLTYSGTTTSGVLTVTDGTHTAKIRLSGDYTTSTIIASSDGHGGTQVVDPPATTQMQAFVAAMAGFGASVGPVNVASEPGRPALSALVAPRRQFT